MTWYDGTAYADGINQEVSYNNKCDTAGTEIGVQVRAF